MKAIIFIILSSFSLAMQAQVELKDFYEIEKSWWTLPRLEYKTLAQRYLLAAEKEQDVLKIGLGNYLMGRYHVNYEKPRNSSVWESFNYAIPIIEKASIYLNKANRPEFQSLIEGLKVKIGRHSQKWDYSLAAIHKIDSLTLTHDNNYVKGYAYYRKAQLFSDINKYDEAIEAYHNAKSSFVDGGFKTYGAVCSIHLANIFYRLGDNKKAKEHFSFVSRVGKEEKALHVANLACYGRFGFYISQGNFDKAKEITDSIVLLEQQIKAIPNVNIRNIHLSRVYEGKKEYGKAISYIEASLDMFYAQYTKQYPYQHMGNLLYNKGRLTFFLGNEQEALKDFEKAIEFSEKANDLSLKGSIYKFMSMVYEESGNYKSAYDALKVAKEIGDSVLNQTTVRQVALLEAYYQNKGLIKEKEILQNNLTITELKGRSNLIWMIAVSFVLILSIVLIIVFNSKKILTQKNNLLMFKEKLFRSQMNPHFIFNVLNAVQFSILKNEPKEAVSSLANFGKLIRDVLEGSREEYISLEKEVRIITKYLEVQKNRLSNKFSYEINLEEIKNINTVYVPPMMIQPVLENAIEHGLKKTDSAGLIIVTIYQVDNKLQFKVKDNGVGFNLSDTSIHKSIGLEITRDRVKFFNNGQDSLKIESELGKGTEVSFIVNTKED